jgi:hypothetical protein
MPTLNPQISLNDSCHGLRLVESAPQVVPAFLSIKNPYKNDWLLGSPVEEQLIKQGYVRHSDTRQYDGHKRSLGSF